MKKFEFKLDTVLKMRTRIQEQHQKELREAERLRDDARKQLDLRKQKLEEVVNTYQLSMTGKLNLVTVNDYNDYFGWLTNMLKSDAQYLAECEAKVAEARRQLIQASKEKKTVENLKDKAFHQYRLAELQAEIKFLDEVGTNRAARANI